MAGKIKYSPSLVQRTKECYWCKNPNGLEHHEFLNGPDKRHAAEDGLWVWTCRYCHTRYQNDNEEMNRGRRICQTLFEMVGTRDEFRNRYRKSYL